MTHSSLPDYFQLLRKWNQAIRLTGDVSSRALERHVQEARALLPHLAQGARVIDVGSGSGFPAVPIALWRPDLDLVLLEPIAKKAAFLRACRRELGLPNIEVRRERDDEHRASEGFRPYDAAVSQATFPPAQWIERGVELVREGGVVLAMLGAEEIKLPSGTTVYREEIEGRPRAIAVFHVER